MDGIFALKSGAGNGSNDWDPNFKGFLANNGCHVGIEPEADTVDWYAGRSSQRSVTGPKT